MPPLPPEFHDDGSDGKNLIEATQTDAPPRKNGRRRHWLGRWLLVVLGAGLGYLGGLYYLSKVPKQYTSTATLRIDPRVDDDRRIERSDVSNLRDLNTMVERIRRHDLLEQVATRQNVRELKNLVPGPAIDWRPDWLGGSRMGSTSTSQPSPVPEPVYLQGMIARWLAVSIRPDTWLIDISITHPEPEAAQELANSTAREYLREIYEDRRQEFQQQYELYERAVSNRASELDEMEAERSKLQRDEASVTPDWAGFEAKINKQRARVLAGILAVLCTGSDDSPVNAIFAAGSDERLGVARQLFDARMAELDLELNTDGMRFASFSVDLSSIARLPGAPSSPNRTQALTLGTLGGLLLALLLAGPRRN
jgi:uncharacterized protein involved in exopolysaccharide biosynthesis